MQLINILVVGTVSAGKSTFINSLFIKKYSDMKLKRTTMTPQIYIGCDKHDAAQIKQIKQENERINNILLDKSHSDNAITINDIKEKIYYVPKITFIKLAKNVNLAIYDTPGLNDSKTKEIFYQYIENNFYKFDIVVYMIDIYSALNTHDEVDILKMLLLNYKKETLNGKNLRLLCLLNKCDEMYLKNNMIALDDDLQEMYDQAEKIITDEIKACDLFDTITFEIIPISCEDSYIYRMVRWNKKTPLDDKYINKFGYNEYGKTRWNRLSDEEKKTKITKILKACNYNERMQLCGFTSFRLILKSWLTKKDQYGYLLNKIIHDIKQIKPNYNINIDGTINTFYELINNSKHISEMFGYTNIALNHHINSYFDDYFSDSYIKSYLTNSIINEVELYKQFKHTITNINTIYECSQHLDNINDKLVRYYSELKMNESYDLLGTCNELIQLNSPKYKTIIQQYFNYNILIENKANLRNVNIHQALIQIFDTYSLSEIEQINIIIDLLISIYTTTSNMIFNIYMQNDDSVVYNCTHTESFIGIASNK